MNTNGSHILWILAAATLGSAMTPVAAAAERPVQPATNNMGKAVEGNDTTASGEKYIKILAPANGTQLSADTPVVLSYDATLAPHGNHIHVYVDNRMAGLSHELKGNFTIGTLAPGIHAICIKEATAAHVLIGVNRCIMVTVK